MKSYKKPHYVQTRLKINQSVQGEPLEIKVERLMNNREPVGGKNPAPLLYMERNEGVRASTNIRTDRWEIALDATEKIQKSYKARRDEKAKDREPVKRDGEAESIQGKGENATNS